MSNTAKTTYEMWSNIQNATLFALTMLEIAKKDAAIAYIAECYGITEETIDAIRDFYTSEEFEVI